MRRLPVLVTVPHGGVTCPKEASSCRLTTRQFAIDGDTWSRELYDLEEHVSAFSDTSVPRAVIDLNRPSDDLPPVNPDGVVKSITVDGTQIWPKQDGPPPTLAKVLIERYHTPWHKKVTVLSSEPNVVLGLDCHTMLGTGIAGHPMAGEPRPLICLSNHGDSDALPVNEPLTAPTDLTKLLFDNLVAAFRHLDVELRINGPRFRLNAPFRGGYISVHHAKNSPIPWIQLEISRVLYLPERFDALPTISETARLADLRKRILKALGKTL